MAGEGETCDEVARGLIDNETEADLAILSECGL